MTAAVIPGRAVSARKVPILTVVILVIGLAATLATGLRAEDAMQQFLLVGLLSALVAIAAIDSLILRAPNRIVYPTCAAATGAGFLLGFDPGVQALIGGAVTFVVLLAIVALGRGAMGYGDAKVAYICGAVVGASNILLLVLWTFAVGGVFAGLALTIGKKARKDAVPFTPFLFIGVVLALNLGQYGVYRLSGGW